jgi:replicative DNA helicase
MIELCKGRSKAETVAEFVRSCKAWAVKENIAIVILAQINRSGAEEKRPRLHHLKDSGALEEVADVVLINYIPFRYGDKTYKGDPAGPEHLEIEIAKIKNYGRAGILAFNFKGEHYRIEDAPDDIPLTVGRGNPSPKSWFD